MILQLLDGIPDLHTPLALILVTLLDRSSQSLHLRHLLGPLPLPSPLFFAPFVGHVLVRSRTTRLRLHIRRVRRHVLLVLVLLVAAVFLFVDGGREGSEDVFDQLNNDVLVLRRWILRFRFDRVGVVLITHDVNFRHVMFLLDLVSVEDFVGFKRSVAAFAVCELREVEEVRFIRALGQPMFGGRCVRVEAFVAGYAFVIGVSRVGVLMHQEDGFIRVSTIAELALQEEFGEDFFDVSVVIQAVTLHERL